MNCPNPNCNTKNLPDDARFCPNCGTELITSKMIVKSCYAAPTNIKLGEKCQIQWQGDCIKHVIINGTKYTQQSITIQPKQSQTIVVQFIGLDDTVVTKQIKVTVSNPEPEKRVRVIYM